MSLWSIRRIGPVEHRPLLHQPAGDSRWYGVKRMPWHRTAWISMPGRTARREMRLQTDFWSTLTSMATSLYRAFQRFRLDKLWSGRAWRRMARLTAFTLGG